MTERKTLFTIGHSTHTLEFFLELLRIHDITAVADVRFSPYSRHRSHFNRDVFSQKLNEKGVKYVFLGRELGGRSKNPLCYENGQVRYSQLARRQEFRNGLDRLKKGALEYRIAIVCAEREPLVCHRTILVSPVLDKEGLSIKHIHADGRLESHMEAMDRLIDLVGLSLYDLFRSREELVLEALLRQEHKIAHKGGIVGSDNTGEDS